LSLDQASRRVLNALPERIVVCSRSGEILFVNRLAEALLGWSAADLDGRHFADLLPRALRQIDAAPFHEVLLARGDEGTIRGSIVHRRGVQIEVDFAASSFGGGGDIALLLRRIAEKESPHVGRVEDTVRAETYRLVFEDAPVGIFHFDDRGVITACNESFTRIIGSSKRVLVGLDMTTLPFRPIVAPLKEALAGKLSRFEGAYPSATSDKLTQVRVEFAPIVSEDGAAVGGVGIAEDVTERVRAEHALRRAFESVRTLLESAPDAIAVHRDERFVLVNAAMVRMLGYDSATELLTAPVLSIIHPEDRSLSVDRRYEMARGSVMPAAEIRLLRKDGTTVVAEVASLRIHYDDEPAILTFSRDVTERRRLEARLAQADRMASIGTLAAGVAHEINNPLAYVMGNLDLLERALAARVDARADGTGSENSPRGDAKSMLSMLRDAREGCERMRNIVGDLRTFSRSETEERVQVDMRAAIDSAITMAQHEIQRRARLVREVQDVPAVLGDPTQLAQVILNLLVNAAQAIAEGHREEHTVCVGARESQGLVEVYVRDDGGGIPKEVIDRVFEPFFTTKPVGIGTGLGLSICRGIVQAHGGALEVESEVGRGTTFRLFLPWAHAPYAVSSGRLPTAEAKVWRARIVVIDDEPQLGRMLRTVLAPHDVAVATSGREGLEMLLSGAPPDLILCDVMMPDVSGVGVYDALRSERPELCDRFVFMTGGAFSEASLQFVAGPAARGLHKPFAAADVERLLASMRRT
jgi:PAS domain S-box-containing protein